VANQQATTAANASTNPLWFTPPDEQEPHRRTLTRERVVSEALAMIGAEGLGALTMRALATHLGVVPGALYRHVRSKEQLHDLILDAVLAEVDCSLDASLTWTEQVTVLAQRLRTVLEDHPGIAGLLKTRDPLSPHSLALAEAFLAPLHAAGLPERQTAMAFRLIYDYTLGFALSDRTSASEQRVQDATTRRQLRAFLRSLPADRFPVLASHGEHVWITDRNERFTASLHTLIAGLQPPPAPHQRGARRPPS
jgi:AcrR family transcriptional regulator